MSLAQGLRCERCEMRYTLDEASVGRCKSCGGTLLVDYDYDAMRGRNAFTIEGFPGIWKYLKLLPVLKQNCMVSLGEGNTFLHRCSKLSGKLGMRKLLIKDESTNPTGAFLDRGVAVEVSKALEQDIKYVRCRAPGNIGASLAAYAAKAGIECTLYLSGRVDVGKLYQMIAYGADIEFARDNQQDAYAAERLIDKETLRLATNSPYFLEGLKTTGYEIYEELDWSTPDRIIVPMGNGGNISMIWRGIKELCEIGLVKEPGVRMCGVQVSGCAPIVKAFTEEEEDVEVQEKVETEIVDIAVGAPTEGFLALRSIYESKGTAVAVSDREVLDAAKALAREEGIFAEPAGASTVAGLNRLVEEGYIGKDEEVVCIITGMGLKDPRSARSFIERSRGMDRFVRAMEEGGFTTRLGETKLHVLKILSRSEGYGYAIWRELGINYGVKIAIASVYQHLSELEGDGLVQRTKSQRLSGKPERRFYSITAKGKSILVQAERMGRTGGRGL